jgi:cytochrome c-type biogenesis protein CcmH
MNRSPLRLVALLVLFGLLGAPDAAVAQDRRPPPRSSSGIGTPKGTPLAGAELDARTAEVGALLRCPVCQGLSVADSPATMARNMKAEVREKLAAGYDREQILQHFERSYGEFVRLEPPMRGVNWLVWLGPLAALLGGGVVVAWALKRSKDSATSAEAAERDAAVASSPSDLPSRETLPHDPRLAAAVRRVRNLAYGWPDGFPPRDSSSP